MHITTSFNLQGQAGNIECNLHLPDLQNSNTEKTLNGLALILHPHPLHGGTMDNKIVQTLIRSVNDLGYAGVRFNFRGVGQSTGIHDYGIGETIDTLKVLAYMRSNLLEELINKGYHINANIPIVLGGFSFGTFVLSNMLEQIDFTPQKILMIGTAAGKWNVKKIPNNNSLIVHGDNDEVIPFEHVLQWAKKYQLPLTIVPDAGHFFHGKLLILKQLVKQSLLYKWE